MKLHLSDSCITINIPEHSSYFLHVSTVLSHHFTKSFWFNNTLINFPTKTEMQQRKKFLTSLYYTCAFNSKTHNLKFLQRLIALHDKPIKVVLKKGTPALNQRAHCIDDPYKMLEVAQTQSLAIIRKQYLYLAKKYHPDLALSKMGINVEAYTAKFQKIQEAYQTIKAEKSKKIAA